MINTYKTVKTFTEKLHGLGSAYYNAKAYIRHTVYNNTKENCESFIADVIKNKMELSNEFGLHPDRVLLIAHVAETIKDLHFED